MKILLTNDDGIFAPGLAAIYKKLLVLGEVTVVAPATSQSGASHSITYKGPLICNKVDIEGIFSGYSVDGSPADCVKLAFMELHREKIDMVVAGINNGSNAGVNVYYSGTVAAAMEAAFLKIPAVALSMTNEEKMDYERGAYYAMATLKKLLPLDNGGVININIPKLSEGQPKGVKVVPQSTQGFHENYIAGQNEQGKRHFQLAGGRHKSEEETTDTISLSQGYISVTPLIADMTDHQRLKHLKNLNL